MTESSNRSTCCDNIDCGIPLSGKKITLRRKYSVRDRLRDLWRPFARLDERMNSWGDAFYRRHPFIANALALLAAAALVISFILGGVIFGADSGGPSI